jgi:hypothetical protein
MTLAKFVTAAGVVAAVTLAGFGAMILTSPRLHAGSDSGSDGSDSKVRIGFAIAPVKLTLDGKDPALVGKGSYIVNAKGLCNHCHLSPDLTGPSGLWAPGHNPFFAQPKIFNASGYLGGGAKFGGFPGQGPDGVGPLVIYGRNLTPGCDTAPCTNPRPEGGHTFSEFLTIFRTGHDFDNAHPACPSLGVEGCLSTSVPGLPYAAHLLQVMPWPEYGDMSDDDIRAVYEYLGAIPCISHAGTVGLPANIYQTCP